MKAKEILDAQLKAAVLAQPQLVLETKAPFESAPLPKSPKLEALSTDCSTSKKDKPDQD